ncbi:MAG: aminoglycoside phosphotransferase family protein [Phycisphaerae bacterium]
MSEWSTDRLEACVRRHLPEADGPLTFERIRTGKFNTSYYVHAGDEDLVLRIAPLDDAVFCFYERGMMKQEPGIHRLLREETDVPVARVLALDESRGIIDRDFLLMERLPGTALSDRPACDPNRILEETGRCLAQVHALTAEAYGYLGAHRPMEPQPAWAEAFRVMWGKLIDDIADTGHYDAAEAKRLVGLLEDHLALFDRPVSSSLLHMDIWSQNLLVDGQGRLSGIVDWDRALWGDPEIEFAVLDYCGISRPAFWRGYGRERDTSPEARVRGVFYFLYELQKYIVIRHGRSRDPAAARRYKREVMRVVERQLG